MKRPGTVRELLGRGLDSDVAIAAPGRRPLEYAALRRHVDATVASLRAAGLERNDRVAIVLPNGPEMASAFVSIACGATTAPLNPAYKKEEVAFYLEDLGARALVVAPDGPAAAVEAARDAGIPVLLLSAGPDDAAGAFRLRAQGGKDATGAFRLEPEGQGDAQYAESGDVALVLHTSGTTSRPKIVPLTHANLCASARNIAATLGLGSSDRCLNVMPLFHIHGLMAAVLASLEARGSVYCTPGFNALKFFAWLRDAAPTWYTAVPTMHQAILRRAARNADVIEAAPLRFIRSSSASLPAPVMREVEAAFGVPVVEAYAMTEASHQMTCNALPPGERKAGTVGVAAGPEVAVMDAAGALLGPGQTGEVVIRGANVTAGYENNPRANAECFCDGWFRTGDQGVMDEDGYLTITGRLKEIINRGGEKISPCEIDDVLMQHPDVGQVVTFSVKHGRLGEDVAAAVVLRDGARCRERDLRVFATQRLADFKVPRTVILLDEIPKGPTGKLQRIGLAKKLGLE